MVGYSLGNSGRFLSEKWHRLREHARRKTVSLEEWGDIDITDYDLENEDPGDDSSEQVPGAYADRDFRVGPSPIESEGSPSESFDIRDLPGHD